MKFGFRMILVLVAVSLAFLCGRIEYLRRCEAFHRTEASRYAGMIGLQKNVTAIEVDAALETAAQDPRDYRLDYKFHQVFHHQSAADVYRQAVYHPWTMVREPAMPPRQYDD